MSFHYQPIKTFLVSYYVINLVTTYPSTKRRMHPERSSLFGDAVEGRSRRSTQGEVE